MLDLTLQTRFEPGTNRKGEASGAGWVYLLDRLHLGRVLFLGAPTPAALAMVAPLATDVMIWEPDAGRRAELHAHLSAHVSIAARPQAVWQLQELGVDLVCRSREARAWRTDSLRGWLRPGGRIYLETLATPWHRPSTRSLDAALGNGSGRPLWLHLNPVRSELRTAVPLADAGTRRWFARAGFAIPGIGPSALARAERAAACHGLDTRIARRMGVLAGGGNGRESSRPPLYLRELAQQNGLDFDAMRWGLWARGRYRSMKVLFFLFPGGGDGPSGSGSARGTGGSGGEGGRGPEYVVKLVRDSAFNARLENEYRTLRALGPELRGHVPDALFLGHPGGLAAVCEGMVPGSAFAARTRGTADCPLAGAAAEWLTSLGAATARPVTPERVAGVLDELLSRYTAIYRPAPEEHAFLAQQIARIAASPAAVPGVLQHGDPGTWNVRVRPDGRVVFTDWEAAESCGMPLWDLLYFLRSYVLLGRMRGLQGRLDTVGRHFLGESPLSGFVHARIARYAERVGVPAELVEPLFHTCWMHRALKEATRLLPDKLADGRFVQLLRWSIARREAPGLQRLFDAGVTT